MSLDPSGHTGPAQVRFYATHVSVLCPFGHLVTGARLDHTWAGSDLEARISSHQLHHDWVVTCHGTLPSSDNSPRVPRRVTSPSNEP